MPRKSELFEDRIDLFEMIECLDRSVVPDQAARFRDDVASARQMWNGAQNLFAALFQWQPVQQRFQSRLILEVQNFLELRDLTFRADSMRSTMPPKKSTLPRLIWKSGNAQPLESFDRDQKNLDVRRLALASEVLDADLRELALPAAFRLLESKNLAGVVKTNRAGRPCSSA